MRNGLWVLAGGLLLWSALLLPGCTPGEDAATDVRGVLSGVQVTPPVVTEARGEATVNLNADRTAMTATVTTTGLTEVQAVEIRVAAPGAVGPVIFTLFDAQTGAPFDGTVTVPLSPLDLQPRPEVGVSTFADAVSAILSGRTYASVRTTAFPSGQIRGQLGAQNFSAVLGGEFVVPPVVTSASGNAYIALDSIQRAMNVTISSQGVTSVTSATIRVGAPGTNGPAIFELYPGGQFSPVLLKTLTPTDLIPQPQVGIVTFADAVDALLNGNTYVQVSTTAFPNGLLRGRLTRAAVPAEAAL